MRLEATAPRLYLINHTRFRRNDDLPLWRGPAVKKKPPFFNVRTLILREIMCSTASTKHGL